MLILTSLCASLSVMTQTGNPGEVDGSAAGGPGLAFATWGPCRGGGTQVGNRAKKAWTDASYSALWAACRLLYFGAVFETPA
jgi:hypothetical protein